MRRLLLLAAAFLLSGCFGKSAPSTFYLMRSIPETQSETMAMNRAAPIGLLVDFPEYAARPQLVVRHDEVQINANNFRRWASPIEAHFTQVLAEDLSWHLKGRKVLQHPWGRDKPTHAVRVKVLQFEGQVDRAATLSVEWQWVDPITDHIYFEERQKWIMPLRDEKDYYHAFTLAMSENVAQLSKRIAQRITE